MLDLCKHTVEKAERKLGQRDSERPNEKLIYETTVSSRKVTYLLQVSTSQVKVLSMENSQVVFQKDHDMQLTELDQIHFFNHSSNPFDTVNGVVFQPMHHTLTSLRLSLGNVTTRDMSVIAQKQLDFEPRMVKQARNRGAYKVLIYNSAAQEVSLMDERLTKVESVFSVNLGDEELIDIVQTQLQVIYFTRRKIGIFRLNAKMDQSNWVCESPLFSIS